MTALPKYLDVELAARVESPVRGDVSNRSPWLLIAAVFSLFVESAERYRRRDVDGNGVIDTFCNFFVRDVCRLFGLELPASMRANELIAWLVSSEGRAAGWEQLAVENDEHVAQAMADAGQLVIACWFNKNGHPGHMALVVPSLGMPGVWIAQAGRNNFSRGVLAQGFGGLPVTFFAHP